VGSALVTTLLERLKSTDCVEVSVSTLMDNQPAIRFYRDHGFVDEALLLEQHLCRVETGVAD
jgi:ribosomal protein S18 acetylase RimI-like enzyme